MPGIDNPILLDLPDFIETERLLLRAPRPGDGAVVYAAVQSSLKELRPWMPWSHGRQSPENSEAYQRLSAAQFARRERLHLNIFRKADGAFVGSTGLERIDWSIPRFEIGYWLATPMTGHGYMTETVQRLTTFCFETLGAARVEIHCDARNTRSAAVAARCGYTREAHLRDFRHDAFGELTDELIFGMTAADYAALGA